ISRAGGAGAGAGGGGGAGGGAEPQPAPTSASPASNTHEVFTLALLLRQPQDAAVLAPVEDVETPEVVGGDVLGLTELVVADRVQPLARGLEDMDRLLATVTHEHDARRAA